MDEGFYNKIEVERVLNLDNDGFCLCSICHTIFIKPQRCLNCDSHFCSGCIENWLFHNKENCPHCKNFKKAGASPLQNKLLSNLKVKCFYNPQCKNILSYDSLLKHESQCPFRKSKPTTTQISYQAKEKNYYNRNCSQKEINFKSNTEDQLKKRSGHSVSINYEVDKKRINDRNDKNETINIFTTVGKSPSNDFKYQNLKTEKKEEEYIFIPVDTTKLKNNFTNYEKRNNSLYNETNVSVIYKPCKVVLLGEAGNF